MARPNSTIRCADRARLGAAAEQAAADFLVARHHQLLLRNYRCRMGELDLVALSPQGTLLVIEVRMRSRQDFGGGAASVDHRKQQRLLRASLHMLATHPRWSRHAMRFDVMDARPAGTGFEITWIQHAFTA
ncbi:MAG: YraN family protein [Steroidobacteraceae bacterium]